MPVCGAGGKGVSAFDRAQLTAYGQTTRRTLRIGGIIAVYAAIIIGGGFLGDWIGTSLKAAISPEAQTTFHRMILIALGLYILLTAIPFVPGVELGLALIMVLGTAIVPIVYVATVAALVLSFGLGRLVPERLLANAFARIGLPRAERMITELAPLSPEERTAHLMRSAPQRWIPWLLKYRLIALILLINMPGSALIGGGGGISMAVGVSRMISFPKFLLAVTLGVLPLPLAVLTGAKISQVMLA
jgi:hypothetical protein